MKILAVHNRYQHRGGEDTIFEAETELLSKNGCEVIRYIEDNHRIAEMSSIRAAINTVWNQGSYAALRELARRYRPDVVHFHNTFPLVSPAGYYAAKVEGAAVVQNIQNYRLLCPKALFLRDGAVCEDCLGRAVAWPAVKYSCYRDSRAASAVVTTMLALHKSIGTWTRKVDRYLVPTEFARDKFIAGGIPASKICVKPNFIYPAPAVGMGKGHYALFVGRLSPEKGIETLVDAWKLVGAQIPLVVVGDGPLTPLVERSAQDCSSITYVGRKQKDEIINLMRDATCLVFPSVWYEGLPLTIIESLSVGTPIVASRIGAMISMIEHERTGLHFTPGDASDLASTVRSIFERANSSSFMRAAARKDYEQKYTAEANFKMLIDIYQSAIFSAKKTKR